MLSFKSAETSSKYPQTLIHSGLIAPNTLLNNPTKQQKQLINMLVQALKDGEKYIRHSYYVGRPIRQSAAEALEKVNIEAEATEDTKFDF